MPYIICGHDDLAARLSETLCNGLTTPHCIVVDAADSTWTEPAAVETVILLHGWDWAPCIEDLDRTDLLRREILEERARLTRYGIEDCAVRHAKFRGAPTDHRLSRWQWRGARGFRFRQTVHRFGQEINEHRTTAR